MPDIFSYTIRFSDFDASTLPDKSRTPGTEEFRLAVTRFLESQYRHFGGQVQISIDDNTQLINVTWSAADLDPSEVVLEMLQTGNYKAALPLLAILKHQEPTNPQHPYNLGMVFSDLGRLDEAKRELREALRLDATSVNAIVAHGVAQARSNDLSGAIASLKEAVKLDPDNPWARRNLGGCLVRIGDAKEAEGHLRRAVELQPNDQQALFGLGQSLEALGNTEEADDLYVQVVRLGSTTKVAEAAKEARTKLAQDTFRKAGGGGERMDAVMYCLGALQKFSKMTVEDVRKIGFEIALLGMKGLDVNDSTQKYSLKSLPGKYSGLHLVCLMFVAFRQVAPEQDVGFDLSKEYAAAESLNKKPS